MNVHVPAIQWRTSPLQSALFLCLFQFRPPQTLPWQRPMPVLQKSVDDLSHNNGCQWRTMISRWSRLELCVPIHVVFDLPMIWSDKRKDSPLTNANIVSHVDLSSSSSLHAGQHSSFNRSEPMFARCACVLILKIHVQKAGQNYVVLIVLIFTHSLND